MKPRSPSSPEDPSKPHVPLRPKEAAPAQRIETDLWDLDDPAQEPTGSETAADSTLAGENSPPSAEAEAEQEATPTVRKPPKTTAGRSAAKPKPAPKPASQALSEDFADLDSLDDEETPPTPAPVVSTTEMSEPGSPNPAATPAIGAGLSPQDLPPEETASAGSPPAPAAAPGSGVATLLRPLHGLSTLEKAGLAALTAILALGTILTLHHWFSRLPTQAERVRTPDFPVAGERITAVAASTYWRAPITEGPDADRFRRGTELLPVLDLTLRGGPGAIRVFFRNEDDVMAGDAITRSVSGETSMSIASTAGFEDLGMHAAYRTEDSDPWIVQVFEGPSIDARSEEFDLLFETTISSERR